MPRYPNGIEVCLETGDKRLFASALEWPGRSRSGGARWTPRYFVRRAAWHVLDHAWELEDRLE